MIATLIMIVVLILVTTFIFFFAQSQVDVAISTLNLTSSASDSATLTILKFFPYGILCMGIFIAASFIWKMLIDPNLDLATSSDSDSSDEKKKYKASWETLESREDPKSEIQTVDFHRKQGGLATKATSVTASDPNSKKFTEKGRFD